MKTVNSPKKISNSWQELAKKIVMITFEVGLILAAWWFYTVYIKHPETVINNYNYSQK